MQELINLIVNNGIGVVCVAYLIYFQHTTLKEMLHTLNSINLRLTIIEEKIEGKEGKNETKQRRSKKEN